MPTSSISFIQPLLDAVAHQQAGRIAEALAGFAHVLELEPEQPQALLFAGVLSYRIGQMVQAIGFLERAVEVRPTNAEGHFALGNALWASSEKGPARISWQEALRHDRRHVGALLNLARAQDEAGEPELAVGNCRTAVTLLPNHPQPRVALSAALRSVGRVSEALHEADIAVAYAPLLAAAHHQRGTALKMLSRPQEAAASLREAVRLAPGDAPSQLNLANVLHELGNLAGAETHCRAAIAADPTMAEAYAVLGFLLTQFCDLDGAIEACNAAISLSPTLSEAHCNLGIALLTAGDLPGGFARYEWRKRHPVYGKEFFSLPDPEWLGGPIDGKSVIIMAEQGLGDAIMFARYAKVLADRGAKVMIACDQRLVPLLQHAPGVEKAVPKQRTMPRFDYWVDQMSLPLLCGTTIGTIPSPDPYLAADPALAAEWRSRLPRKPDNARRVGVVWAGNPLHSNDANRSSPIEIFERILALPGVVGTSLQVGDRAAEAASLGLQDWSPQLSDYAETAALVDAMDIVITVDTSVAHLAAALGKPTWILIPHCPEWRWLQHRTDTPWYDCVRLFRQPAPGDWNNVVNAIARALRELPALPPA